MVFSCLNRYVSAFLFVCVQEYLSVSWSGIWNYSTSRHFFGQITIWATNVEEEKNVYCTIALARASIAKNSQRPLCWETVQEKPYTFCFEWLVCILRTHVGVQKERVECILQKQWENLATWVDNSTFPWQCIHEI